MEEETMTTETKPIAPVEGLESSASPSRESEVGTQMAGSGSIPDADNTTKPSASPFGLPIWVWCIWFGYAGLGINAGQYFTPILMALWMIFVICGGLQKWLKK